LQRIVYPYRTGELLISTEDLVMLLDMTPNVSRLKIAFKTVE
jgi:hypothetical protein